MGCRRFADFLRSLFLYVTVFDFRFRYSISISVFYCSIFSQPVGTTGVESTNFHWVFELRSANLSLKLDPHSFKVRSKRDLQPSGNAKKGWKTTGMAYPIIYANVRNGSLRRQHELKHRICVTDSTNCRV